MKKFLLVLGMIVCMMGLTACGKEAEEEQFPFMSAEEAEEEATQMVVTVSTLVDQDRREEIVANDAYILLSAYDSWEAAMKDMGEVIRIVSIDTEIGRKDAITIVELEGEKKNASVEIVYENRQVQSMATNVEYTFGEKMQKAALNTLLGMGTVFVVLILISFIISAFTLIPKIQAKSAAKKATKANTNSTAVDNTIAQIIEKEELSDDLELVAVISAAIAASEGASSTDGFVVRSIKRAGSKWQRA